MISCAGRRLLRATRKTQREQSSHMHSVIVATVSRFLLLFSNVPMRSAVPMAPRRSPLRGLEVPPTCRSWLLQSWSMRWSSPPGSPRLLSALFAPPRCHTQGSRCAKDKLRSSVGHGIKQTSAPPGGHNVQCSIFLTAITIPFRI